MATEVVIPAALRASELPHNAVWVCAWTDCMAEAHGGVVRDATGAIYDWGQALARTQYGPDWEERVPDCPTDDDVRRAQRWLDGDWPDWVVSPQPKEAP